MNRKRKFGEPIYYYWKRPTDDDIQIKEIDNQPTKKKTKINNNKQNNKKKEEECFYIWEWNDFDKNRWTSFDFDNLSTLEIAYSVNQKNMDICISGLQYYIDFEKMIQTNKETKTIRGIRRRPRPTKENVPLINGITAYQMEWIFENSPGNWSRDSQISDVLERSYLNKVYSVAATMETNEGPQLFYFNMETFTKTNSITNTKHLLRRVEYPKPQTKWISSCIQIKNRDSLQTKKILLSEESDDFKMITRNIHISGFIPEKIVSISRIDNPLLYQMYLSQKNMMIKKNNNNNQTNEKLLFHGTKPDSVEKIVEEGFDVRYNKTHAYGKGNYFATSAKMAHSYTSPDKNEIRTMFLSNVLVGEYTTSPSNLIVSPPKKPDGNLFDSVTDTKTPSIYVTFERAQSYPTFLIRYISK